MNYINIESQALIKSSVCRLFYMQEKDLTGFINFTFLWKG